MQPTLYDEAYFRSMRGGDGAVEAEATGLYAYFLDLLDIGAIGPGSAVLDVGCGRGDLLGLLQANCPADLYGLDFSPVAVELTRTALGLTPDDPRAARILHGSATDPELFAPESLDLVTMMDVVEHLSPSALAAALANIRLWLKPGGRLVFHTFPTLVPHRAYLASLWLLGRHQRLAEVQAIHCNVQTRDRLTAALTEAGFSIETMWLRNDLVASSSQFQGMADGPLRKLLHFVARDLLNHPGFSRLCDRLGIAELVHMSIYGIATRPNPNNPGRV